MIWVVRFLILLAGPFAAYYFFEKNTENIVIGLLISVIFILLSFLLFKSNKKTHKSISTLILDKSSLMDGRIYDLIKADFFTVSTVVISKQTLNELKKETASEDIAIKNKAKRASFIIDRIQKTEKVKTIISSKYSNINDEVLRLSELSRDFKARIITSDFNIYKNAVILKTPVLNLNFLEKALNHVFLPGEKMSIYLLKEGSQNNQAVGFLNDGTMVVAENGKKFIGKKVEMTVSSVIQTSSNKMLFGKVDENQLQNTYKYSKSGAR